MLLSAYRGTAIAVPTKAKVLQIQGKFPEILTCLITLMKLHQILLCVT
jgi:hypothetical protein